MSASVELYAKLRVVPWTRADSYTLTRGAHISGTVEDTWSYDASVLDIREVTGAPGFDFYFTFKNIPTDIQWLDVDIWGRYEGNPAHQIKIRVWDWVAGVWDNIFGGSTDWPSGPSIVKRDFPIENPIGNDYIQDGEMRIQFYHASSGNTSHHFYTDEIKLERAYVNDLKAVFVVAQDSNDLYAKFEAQAVKNLFAEFELQKSEDLKAVFLIRQESEDLFAEFELQTVLDFKTLALISGLGYVVKGGNQF